MTANTAQPARPPARGWPERFGCFFQPVDASSLVYFRIAFGSIMLWETWRFVRNDWVGYFFSGKEFYFTYWPFDFLHPWPQEWMYVHLVLMGIFASFIILGFCYRISATAFFLMITYLFLLEQARYLNHLYLVCLLSFLMIFLPANRYFSLDVLLRPSIKSITVPAWSLWLLRFQIAVPMFFGGIAKLNSDWLHGEPLRAWLSVRTDFPLLGQFFANETVVWVMVYGSLLVDLLFIFYMLNRRTRVFGLIVVLAFHFMNARLFDIGIFPWFMIAATLVFFAPDWPVRVLKDVKLRHNYRLPALVLGLVVGFLVGGFLPERFDLVHALIGGLGVAVAAYHLDEPFLKSARAEETNGVSESPPRASWLNRMAKIGCRSIGAVGWASGFDTVEAPGNPRIGALDRRRA
ncbi:MAG: HTTM domain-containing protein [Chloroflexi bacterium]|nr:HTTM domain-containing protein [Chloroflexota bacterium]MDA1219012.1 HTTM domain-containing protein [Chloroflexota bacterium]